MTYVWRILKINRSPGRYEYKLNFGTRLNLNTLTKLIPFFFLLLTSREGAGQRFGPQNMVNYDEERFHFGFVLGGNLTYATIRPIADLHTRIFASTYIPDILPLPDSARVLTVESRPTPGFVISIVGDMRIGRNMNLRFIPSLTFGDRDLLYTVEVYRGPDTLLLDITKKVPSTYINFPLELKYKSERYHNLRGYVLGGVQYTIDLASQAKKREQKNRDQKIVKFASSDIYLIAGAGFDFYNEWFKLGVEVKMMYGLFDVLTRERNIYTDSIDRLSSKIFQLSFTFE